MTAAVAAQACSVLTFRVEGRLFAMDAASVQEVVRSPRITRVPGGPSGLKGVTNLRGAVTPVVSGAALLNTGDEHGSETGAVIVMDFISPLAIAVDAVVALKAIEIPGAGRVFAEADGAYRIVDLEAALQALFRRSDSLARRRTETLAEAAPIAVETRAQAFMVVEVAGQDYGLPLDAIVEVAVRPGAYHALPGGLAADLGVVPYRGGALPVVSLAALLGLTQSSDAPGGLVVARVGAIVGLAVDRLKQIRRVPEAMIGDTPAVLNRGGGEAMIASIARLGEGEGVLSILSPETLFRDEALAPILAEGRQEMQAVTTDVAVERENVLVFRLGEETYGLPAGMIDEVLRLPDTLTRVPNAPAFIEGVMNLRGRVVPVIDQSARFEASRTDGAGRKVIVTSVAGLHAGFIVDGVSEILSLAPGDFRPASELLSSERTVFDRVATVGERVILIVDPQALLNQAEADILAALEREHRVET